MHLQGFDPDALVSLVWDLSMPGGTEKIEVTNHGFLIEMALHKGLPQELGESKCQGGKAGFVLKICKFCQMMYVG